MLLRGLGLGVALVVFRRVLLRREQRVERDVKLRTVLVVVILRRQPRRPALHAVEVRGDEVAVQPQRIAVLRGGVLLFEHSELAHHAVMRGGHRARQLTPAALRGLLPVALGVEGIEQRGEGWEGRLHRLRAVLRDGTIGEVHGLSLAREHGRCKAIFPHSFCQAFHFRGKALAAVAPVREAGVGCAEGAKRQLARDERRDAEIPVEQEALDGLLRSPAAAGQLDRPLRVGQQRELVKRRRKLIVQPRQQRPRTGDLKLHTAHTIQNAVVLVEQQEV